MNAPVLEPVEVATARAADGEARTVAQTRFDVPIALEAGAGSGKTACLVARVAHWALSYGWQRSLASLTERGPDQVAARTLERVALITFTEKAAAEMVQRLALAFRRVAQGEDVTGLDTAAVESAALEAAAGKPVDLRQRAASLLVAMDRVQASTIHAFCRRILSRHALAVGLHPRFRVDADGRGVLGIVDEVMAEATLRAFENGEANAFTRLMSDRIEPQRIADALFLLAQQPGNAAHFAGDPYAPERVGATIERLSSNAGSLADQIEEPLRAGHQGHLRSALRLVDGLRRLEGLRFETSPPTIGALSELAADVAQSSKTKLDDWLKGKFSKSEGQAFELLDKPLLQRRATALQLQLANLSRLDAEKRRAGNAVIAPLLAEVEERLRARGIETFDALLTDTQRLLREDEEARREVQASLDQLLVDEFQDTDPLQCELVRWIALDGPADQRPGLFLVGDPKQSIYGWRSADLAAYEGFLGELKQHDGQVHTLSVNFRSVPAILTEVDRVSRPVMQPVAGLQPKFESLIPAPHRLHEPGFQTSRCSPVEHWISWELDEARTAPGRVRSSTLQDRARELEARALAADLVRLRRDHELHFGSVAVLLRTTSAQDTYLEALKEADIPYVVERDRSFFQRREVIDLLSLLTSIVDPHDSIALIGWLRSPSVGVPDAAWVPLWRQRFPDLVHALDRPDPDAFEELDRAIHTAASQLPSDAPGIDRVRGWDDSLRAAVRTLAHLRDSLQRDQADHFLGQVSAWTLNTEIEAFRFLGRHRVANSVRLLQRIRSEWITGGRDLRAVLRDLRRGIEEQREEDEASPGDESLDAVRVMTIHKSKGLTFEHVYLVDLHSKNRPQMGSANDEVVTLAGEDAAAAQTESMLFGVPSLDFDRVERQRKRVEAAEAVRTLYVAMTRPHARLVLCGSWPKEAAALGASTPAHVQLLAHREHARNLSTLPDDLESDDALQEPLFTATGDVDPHGVRWRLLGASADEAVESLQSPDPVRTAAFQAQAEIDTVERARTLAAARAARPWTVKPSKQLGDWDLAQPADHEDTADAIADALTRPSVLRELSRAEARSLGTAVHRLLERVDLGGDLIAQVRRRRRKLDAWIEKWPDPPPAPSTALRRATGRFLDALSGSRLLARLDQLRHSILARELPLLLSPELVPGRPESRPVGASTGTLDLLYRDDSRSAWVVADYKMNAITHDDELLKLAEHYSPQGRSYVTAVQRFLRCTPAEVRFELWFLDADRIVEVDLSRRGAPQCRLT